MNDKAATPAKPRTRSGKPTRAAKSKRTAPAAPRPASHEPSPASTPTQPASKQPDAMITWMEGLADTTRLRLLRLLERQELGVTELCDVLQMPQSTVSRHLKVLADQGWVFSRRQGTTNRYHMLLDELAAPARQLWLLARQQAEDWATLQQDQIRLDQVLAQRKKEAQSFFAGAAGKWDKLREELYGSAFITHAMLGLIPAHYTVADLGCGTGSITIRLAQHVARVIGVDQSEAMLAAATRRLKEAGISATGGPSSQSSGASGGVELKQGDLENLPIDDAICDAVLVSLVLTYLPDPAAAQAALAQAWRILKPGGQLVLVDLLKHDRDDFRREMGQQSMGFEPAELEQLLTTANFIPLTTQPLPPTPEATGPALLLATARKP